MVNSGVLSSIVKCVCGWVRMLCTGLDMAKTRKKYRGMRYRNQACVSRKLFVANIIVSHRHHSKLHVVFLLCFIFDKFRGCWVRCMLR